MVALPEDTETRLATYLAEAFPLGGIAPHPRARPHRVTFEQWQVPTLGQRSRDPVEGPDGRIWWVGQWGNLVGVLDLETGDMREYPVRRDLSPQRDLDSAGIPWLLTTKRNTSAPRS